MKRAYIFNSLIITIVFLLTLTGQAISQDAGGAPSLGSGDGTSTPTIGPTPGTGQPSLPTMQGQSAGTEQMMKNLSPEQQNIVQQEMIKRGGTLTPEAIKTLRERPEFQSLTPEDIAKGKDVLKKKEEDEKKMSGKQVPGVPAGKAGTLFYRMKNLKGYQEISTDLKPFGFEFFQEGASKVTTERQDVPVPGNYIVGPGDEVRILLWGRVNSQHNLMVDKDGNITVPQIGPIPVAGMTFEQMSVNVIQQAEKIIGCSVNITMGRLKSIPVFILGDVAKPGSYMVGSFATITDALLLAGGPSAIGSLRGVQLKRKGKVLTTFDLYDLLLKGDKSKDAMLQAGDVIFVPVTGPLVGIAGNVKRPAIYELKGRQNLQTVIELAGGILPTAYTNQIQVERIVRNERQVVIDLDDRRLSAAKDFMLAEADLVKIFNIAEEQENVVYVLGNVKRPGKYEYRTKMHVKDLIKDVKDLEYETHLEYALIKRMAPPGSKSENELIPFNLAKLLVEKDESQNIELRPQDNIFIFSKWFFTDKPSIVVEGGVRSGGTFDLVDNLTVKDAVLLAGGLTRDASVDDVELYRMNLATNKRFIERVNLKKALNGDPEHNVLLRNFDRITVKKIHGVKEERLVTVSGEVSHPGKYAVQRGERLSSVLERAGGYSENAYLKGAIFTRVRVKEMQRKAMEEMVRRLERELYSETAVADSNSPEAKKLELQQRKQFIESMKKIDPNGRMSIKLVHLRLLKGSAFDIEIENGDVLDIPTKNSVVNVTGAVMSQGSCVYLDEMEYSDYVNIAGGYTRYADKGNSFVLKADGTARRVNGGFMNWSTSNSRWELAAFNEDKGKLDPGDTIIVPEKLDRIAWLKELKDWTQILMQISVIGATVNYMFK
ncbi:MAG: SLBB domain-containing protein [Syntrophorhabdaceae bacterium]